MRLERGFLNVQKSESGFSGLVDYPDLLIAPCELCLPASRRA